LEDFIHGAPTGLPAIEDPHLLVRSYGAFVTLRNGRELRGCIGTCYPTGPLYETVIEMTKAAASRDHRAPPIAEGELAHIHIDISVLSALRAVDDPLALQVNRHGIHIECGQKAAVFLPQVAAEYGWDIETLLVQACIKAELPETAWTWPQTKISSFTALVVEEEE
jgi:AmmeMemoRadiSam system protein A